MFSFKDLPVAVMLQLAARRDEISVRLEAVAERLPDDEPLPELTLLEKLGRCDPRWKRACEMLINLLVTGDTIDTALETLETLWPVSAPESGPEGRTSSGGE